MMCSVVRIVRGGCVRIVVTGFFVTTIGSVSIELQVGSTGGALATYSAQEAAFSRGEPPPLAASAAKVSATAPSRVGVPYRVAAVEQPAGETMIDTQPFSPAAFNALLGSSVPGFVANAETLTAGNLVAQADLLSAATPQQLPRVAFVADPVSAAAAPSIALVAARPGQIASLSVEDPVAFQTAAAKATSVSLMTAYAPDDGALVEGPFNALFNAMPGRIQGVSDNGLDHWWSDRPLPANMTTGKQLKCLAEAIYFEARSEPESGQAAVAQVIVNRIKNPAFPDTACDVVYQNRDKRNACQFSFACDGKDEDIHNQAAWDKAMKVAREYAGGRSWLAEIGASTHYHADYVEAGWAKRLKPVVTVGRHIFYFAPNGGWS